MLPALTDPRTNRDLLRAALNAAQARLESEKESVEAELQKLTRLGERYGLASDTHVTPKMIGMTPVQQPRQLRLIIETDDFDKALRFYRDVLGLTEQPAFATDGEDRVSILNVDAATIELATPTHVRNIDAIENMVNVPGSRTCVDSSPTPLPPLVCRGVVSNNDVSAGECGKTSAQHSSAQLREQAASRAGEYGE